MILASMRGTLLNRNERRGEVLMEKTVFKKGFKAVKEEQVRREKAKAQRKGRIWRYYLNDGDEDVPLQFLTEEPLCFFEHSVQEGGKFTNVPCIGEGCKECAKKKPSYSGAWLVVDGRTVEIDERDSNGQKTGKKKKLTDQIKMLVRGVTTMSQLDRLSSKYGLMDRMWYLTKTGKNTDTVWNFDRGDDEEISSKRLKALLAQLPEELRGLTPDEIVEQQMQSALDMAMGEAQEDDPEESEEDIEKARSKVKSKIQKIDEDDEEEDKPKRSSRNVVKPKPKPKTLVRKR